MLLGLVLAGLEPVWVRPEVDAGHGLPLGVTPAALEAALTGAPDATAVFVGDPSYVGTVGDAGGLATVAHRQASRWSSTRRGGHTSGSTRPCRRTPSPQARMRW